MIEHGEACTGWERTWCASKTENDARDGCRGFLEAGRGSSLHSNSHTVRNVGWPAFNAHRDSDCKNARHQTGDAEPCDPGQAVERLNRRNDEDDDCRNHDEDDCACSVGADRVEGSGRAK